MTLTMAYTRFWLSFCLLAALVLAGCWGTPTEGPRIDARGNSGTITANITSGSSSPASSAPCGATSSQKAGENRPKGPDCSDRSQTFVPPTPEAS